jgi:regulator of nucleoside diphosphate kinase
MNTGSTIVTKTDLKLLGLLSAPGPLQRKLARARVVPAGQVPADVVTMNSRVRYCDESDGMRRHVKLVHPQHADGRGLLSVLAPLGTALLGLSAGQEIEVDFPGGGRRRIRVEEVVSQPERELRRLTLDEKLDEALKQTFPASDAFAFSLGF